MGKRGSGILIAVIGVIAALIGVVMGFVPLSAIGEACGSVFAPTTYGASSVASAFVDNLCADKITGQTVWVWALVILGLAALVFGLVRAVRGDGVRLADTISHA